MPVLAMFSGFDLATKCVRHELQAVANSEHGKSQLKYAWIGTGRVFVIDGRRPSGKNDPHRRIFLDVFNFRIAGENGGKDVLFADAACDQLRILRPKVEDNN